jgi:arylsulfatase A-like enzyme
MPTLLELCGIPTPGGVQGMSYLPLLEGDGSPVRGEIYYEICMEKEGPEAFPVPERGVRTHDWLYVRTEQNPTALFHLAEDPLEMDNLVSSERHRDVAGHLDGLLRTHMAATGDGWDVAAHFPPENFQSHEEGAAYAEALLSRAAVEP